jgi:hypothetical protein
MKATGFAGGRSRPGLTSASSTGGAGGLYQKSKGSMVAKIFQLAAMAALAHMAEKEILGIFYRGRDGTNDDLARHS